MTRNLPTYIAGVAAVALTGAAAYCSIGKSVNPMDFENVQWCERDSRGKTTQELYFGYLEKHEPDREVVNPVHRKKFVEEVLLRNNGNIRKPRIMLPCDL